MTRRRRPKSERGIRRVVCTGVGAHRPRTIAEFMLVEPCGFTLMLLNQDMAPGAASDHDVKVFALESMTELAPVQMGCPSCRRDMRFSADTFERFLRLDTGAMQRDASRLAATLSKNRQGVNRQAD